MKTVSSLVLAMLIVAGVSCQSDDENSAYGSRIFRRPTFGGWLRNRNQPPQSGITAPIYHEGETGITAPIYTEGQSGITAPIYNERQSGIVPPIYNEGSSGITAPIYNEGQSGISPPIFNGGESGISAPIYHAVESEPQHRFVRQAMEDVKCPKHITRIHLPVCARDVETGEEKLFSNQSVLDYEICTTKKEFKILPCRI